MRCLDPSRMSAPDRVAELGELLAAGVQRLLAHRCKPVLAQDEPANAQEQLDVLGAVEAPCRSSIEVPA